MNPDDVDISTTHPPLSNTAAPKPQPKPVVENAPPKSPIDDVAEKKEKKQEAEESSGDVKKNTARDGDDCTEEDDVVREIEVFFKPNLDRNTQLYVLQYLERPRGYPYDLDRRCVEVRLKRGTAKIEMDLSSHPPNENCDQEFANNLKMGIQTLVTEWDSGSSSDHAIGVLVGNKLHLNVVDAVVQLQPSKNHLKHDSSRRKRKASDPGEETSFSPIKKQNKHTAAAALSTEYEEIWVPLQYHGTESEVSAKYLKRMVAQDSSTKFGMKTGDCVNYFGAGPSQCFSKRDSPIEEHIKNLFVKEPLPRRFSDLKKNYARQQNQEKELLDVLQKNGLLLHNHWVPKTELLYPKKEGYFRENGVDDQLTARNYILNCLRKNPVIGYPELDVYPLLKPYFTRIMKFLVNFKPSTGDWEMQRRSDVSFAELYPEIYKSQEQLWERMEEQLEQALRPHYERAALTEAVKTVFQSRPVCNFEFIRRGLVSSCSSKDCASGFHSSPEELEDVLADISNEIGGVYVLKSALKERRENYQFRDIVIELLRTKNKGPLSKSDVMLAAQLKLGRKIGICEYWVVMLELCVLNDGQWYLRSGDGISTH